MFMDGMIGYEWYLLEGEKEKEKHLQEDLKEREWEEYIIQLRKVVCIGGIWGINGFTDDAEYTWNSWEKNNIDDIIMVGDRFKNILNE